METIYLVYTPVAARVGEDDNSPFKIIDTLEEAKVILEGNYKLQDPDKVIKVIKVKDYDESNPESGIMRFIGLRDKDFSISSSQIGSQSEEGVYDRSLPVGTGSSALEAFEREATRLDREENQNNPDNPFSTPKKGGSRSKRKTPLNKRSRKMRNGLTVKMEK
jgi:hypothetical protein